MDDVLIERVLRTVEAIPPGRVAPYGRVGQIAGTGARQVGRIMSTWSEGTPWWRVPRADGTLPDPLLARARTHWEEEGTPVRSAGARADLPAALADLEQLRRDAERAWESLDEHSPE